MRDNDSEVNKPLTVEAIDNDVYFYSKVDTDRCLALIQKIKYLDSDLRNERLRRRASGVVPIWLHIHSGGGDLFAAFGVADQFAQIETPIYSIVEGVCASAATILSVACQRRLITANSFMLIHQLSTWAFGTHAEIQDHQRMSDMAMDAMIALYSKRTKLNKTKIRALLARDSWFSAKEAVEAGLVDEIL